MTPVKSLPPDEIKVALRCWRQDSTSQLGDRTPLGAMGLWGQKADFSPKETGRGDNSPPADAPRPATFRGGVETSTVTAVPAP